MLRMYGIGTNNRELKTEFIVSSSSIEIKKILLKTPWANGWRGLLIRLPSAEKSELVTFSPGVRSRGVVLSEIVLGEIS